MDAKGFVDGAAVKVVVAPVTIEITNAQEIGEELRSAVARWPVVVADLTDTECCDLAGAGELALAHAHAAAYHHELRLAIAAASVLRLLALTGLDREVHVYPSLATALAAGSVQVDAYARAKPPPAVP